MLSKNHGPVWHGALRCGIVWYGVVRCGVVWYGALCGVARLGAERGMALRDMVWHGMVRYGMACQAFAVNMQHNHVL